MSEAGFQGVRGKNENKVDESNVIISIQSVSASSVKMDNQDEKISFLLLSLWWTGNKRINKSFFLLLFWDSSSVPSSVMLNIYNRGETVKVKGETCCKW